MSGVEPVYFPGLYTKYTHHHGGSGLNRTQLTRMMSYTECINPVFYSGEYLMSGSSGREMRDGGIEFQSGSVTDKLIIISTRGSYRTAGRDYSNECYMHGENKIKRNDDH